MRTLKHLPENEWPEAHRQALRAAYEPGDIFDETAGPGAHLAESSRKAIKFAYRRWLGFLKANYADDLSTAPPERITPERVRAFIEHLSAQIKPTSVAIAVAHLYFAARLIAPTTDWAWLRSVKSRLECLARPEDRFDRLVPPVETLDHGIELMDTALTLPPSDGHKEREIQYRDGLHIKDARWTRADCTTLFERGSSPSSERTCAFMTSVGRRRPSWRWTHRKRSG